MPDKVLLPTWYPITDPIDLRHLSKLAEELGECSAITARIICQGMLERNPDTNTMNIVALSDEIADVLANCELVIERFSLPLQVIQKRKEYKKERLKKWHYGESVKE